ncbi:MAG: site-specific integrase [Myxococcales bacterium]|nr:site-specific integrase [Myxococcales bacterium]
MTALLKACADLEPRLLPLVLLIANTGCRNGEALALTWDNVDLEGGFVRFWPSEEWQPKNDKPREVPISDALLPWLRGPRHHPNWVFPSRAGSRFAFWPMLQWTRVRDAAGLTGGVHQLRHTFASHFLADQPDLVLLAEVLGHSDVAVTRLYKHMLPDHLARARNVVNFAAQVGPAAIAAKCRWSEPTRKPDRTVPGTVPRTPTNAVSIERDKGFEPSTFSLGS